MNWYRYVTVFFVSLTLVGLLSGPGWLWPTSAVGAPALQGSIPVDGHWTGTTNRGQPMSFDVSSGGTVWRNFKLRATGQVGFCNVTVDVTAPGPGTINGNQFSFSGNNFSFSGQFISSTFASGTYNLFGVNFPGCGTFSQSGTWTASTTAPPGNLTSPSNLTALAVSSMQILLSWQDSNTSEFGFKVEQSLDSVNWTQIATTPATSYAPTGLACNTRYYYRVRAYNASSNSGYSNIANAKTTSCGFTLHLPIILKAPGAPPPPSSPPMDGHWVGTTNLNQPISFDVTTNGANWNSFKLKTTYSQSGCSGTVEITVGPGVITNQKFSYNGGNFSFSGQFTSPTTASGSYIFANHPGCNGNFSQSGTWTASKP